MRYWFDTEFHDDGHTVELISIGVVAEDGREYFAANAQYPLARAQSHDFLRQHVVPYLPPTGSPAWLPKAQIKQGLEDFFRQPGGTPEFWADCGEYDWVLMRQLWGELTQWPTGWPYLAMDIEQWRIQLGAPHFPRENASRHDALQDARLTRANWQWLHQFLATRNSATPLHA